MIIGLTGATGNMGQDALAELLKLPIVTRIKILGHNPKRTKKLLQKNKKYQNKIDVIYGGINNHDSVKEFIADCDYVINMAAVIPPLADKRPDLAVSTNELGVKVLIEEIEKLSCEPKFIHISTMGIYGNRDYKHPFGEVGDPLLPSPFDIYSLSKMRGEFSVLESNIKNWVILRQTAVLYNEMLFKNVSDGLMFHTCFNAPLEWVTSEDSAILIKNIILKDNLGELNNDNFWLHCFNIGGGLGGRVTGYEVFDEGFKLIGASTTKFFKPNYNATRNFHGMWYSDGYKLEELFHYQNESFTDCWHRVAKTYPFLKIAKIIPTKLLKHFVIDKLLKDSNAPMYWTKNGDTPRVNAYLGGIDEFNKIGESWRDFPLVCKNQNPDVLVDYETFKATPTYLEHGFDLHKNLKLINLSDLQNVAKMHGGSLITADFTTGDIYTKVEWVDQDGNHFWAKPYTVLGCGHWYNISYQQNVWDFDRLSKKDQIYAQIWYDTHTPFENKRYSYTDDFKSHEEDI